MMTTTEEIAAIRKALKTICPTLSVRNRRGTGYGNIAIKGSGKYGEFNEAERQALKTLGISSGLNFAVILRDSCWYWYAKLVEKREVHSCRSCAYDGYSREGEHDTAIDGWLCDYHFHKVRSLDADQRND